jgi:hypothetical protein
MGAVGQYGHEDVADVVRFAPGSQRIVGLTVINARYVLERDDRLIVTVPETFEASADELAPALKAA